MRIKSNRVLFAVLALAGAAFLTLDAQAGNLRSSSTPVVHYFYRVIPADSYFQWIGSTGSIVLIDDVIFAGHAHPSDVAECEFELTCSFFDIMGEEVGEFSDELGPILNVNMMTVGGWGPGPSPVGGGTMWVSSSSSNTASTIVFVRNRAWEHELRLVQAGGNPHSGTVDKLSLTGHAAVAGRETRITTSFSELMLFRQSGEMGMPVSTSTSVGGAGGAGAGVGTGIGGIGWLTETSSARHYQTPYIMHGSQLQLLQRNFPNGEVILHGRVIVDPEEAPTITNSFSIQPM